MADILDRLKNRKRATVAERDNSLLTDDNSSESIRTPLQSEIQSSSIIDASEMRTRLAALPLVADRRQIRLESSIDQELENLCKNQPKGKKMTVETFLEAAFLTCKDNPELMNQVMDIAAQRLSKRKEAGKLRRVFAQLE
jgi:hypothetical protein